MRVSTFELLINKQQFPKVKDLPKTVRDELNLTAKQEDFLIDLSREVIQGYFLTISNLMNIDIELIISFLTADSTGNSSFNQDVFALFDVEGKNEEVTIVSSSTNNVNYLVKLPAKDTGKLIVQANPKFIFDPKEERELRGYVEIRSNKEESIKLLVTPEHRATFYRRNNDENNPIVQLDQTAYALPTATGSSMFEI